VSPLLFVTGLRESLDEREHGIAPCREVRDADDPFSCAS
jgi:hypothetical protein